MLKFGLHDWSLESRYFLVKVFEQQGDDVKSYNACNRFICKFCCTVLYLSLLQTTLLAQPCIEKEFFSCIQILEPKTMPFVSTIPTYYMEFLCHSKVHYLSATFKILFFAFAIYSSWENSLKTIVVKNMQLMYLISYKLLVER